MKFSLVFLVFVSFVYGYDQCRLSHASMVLLAKVEKHPRRKLGYPYLISFNNKKDAKKVWNKYKDFFIKKHGVGRTIDCLSEDMCLLLLNEFLSIGIKNLDLGSFQINYKYHRISQPHYFRVAESYEYACAYAQIFVDKYGSTFKSLAMYHSKTPKYRNKYARRMYDEYKKSNH